MNSLMLASVTVKLSINVSLNMPSGFSPTSCVGLILLSFNFVYCSFNVPVEHLPFVLYSQPENVRNTFCDEKNVCEKFETRNSPQCWGYEKDCNFSNSYSQVHLKCAGPANWRYVKNKEEQIKIFYEEADFGYVRERLKLFSVLCEPQEESDSYLACVDHLRFCTAKNIFFDFKDLEAAKHSNKYRDDFIHSGQVGGKCSLKKSKLQSLGDHKSPLQSWAAELLPFENFDNFRMNLSFCDKIIDEPTILFKLDAGVSMFHHFCDFVNLYISQHINNSFDTQVRIVMWDTSGMPYNDLFVDTWKAFTSLPLIHLKDFDGLKVCFRQAMFPLLARMQFGMYYNMPLISGCQGSGLFHAFSKHLLHRLSVKQNSPVARKIRITLLTRSTKHRRILNEDEILGALKTVGEYEVLKVDYNHKMPFLQQLEITANSDIFMGIHGSGLTHLLFLPDWASVFEIHNCEDASCYYDLARLRGVNYFTWQKANKVYPEDEGHHPTLGAHAKFTNYAFDVDEFMRIVGEAANSVRNHPLFVEEQLKFETIASKKAEL